MSLLFWGVYFPILFILRTILYPFVYSRWTFENKNLSETGARSFAEQKLKADLCFEFSSEGEYQQVASLIDDALVMNKKIELVFFSPSVEKAIVELAKKYPTQIRYLRYPLVTFGPFHSFTSWVTASELVMVRYDLFPEFLLWARKPENTLKMVWVSFKKEKLKNKNISWIKNEFLKASKVVFFASESDKLFGQNLGFKGEAYDFRMEQIRRRILLKDEKFAVQFPQYQKLKAQWENYPRDKRLIMGNAWPADLPLLKDLPADYFVLIVPHKLEPEILKAFHEGLKSINRHPLEILGAEVGTSDSMILNKKGVLCELYADFGRAYVGGGMGVSVHSLLEPLVAGSEYLSSGPVHHRSTEYDVALSLGSMTEVKNAQDFNLWLGLTLPESAGHDKIKPIFERYPLARKAVISC